MRQVMVLVLAKATNTCLHHLGMKPHLSATHMSFGAPDSQNRNPDPFQSCFHKTSYKNCQTVSSDATLNCKLTYFKAKWGDWLTPVCLGFPCYSTESPSLSVPLSPGRTRVVGPPGSRSIFTEKIFISMFRFTFEEHKCYFLSLLIHPIIFPFHSHVWSASRMYKRLWDWNKGHILWARNR